jgi:hypothetical protein
MMPHGVDFRFMTETTRQLGLRGQGLQVVCERLGVCCGKHQSRPVMIDDLGQTALIGHDHRKTGPHGLENRDSETFADRRKGEDIEGREHGRYVTAGPEEDHLLIDSEFSSQTFELSAKRAVSYEHETPGCSGRQPKGPKEGGVTLFSAQCAHVSDHEGIVVETHGMPRLGLGWHFTEKVRVDTIVEHLHTLIGEACVTDHLTFDGPGHGHYTVAPPGQ